MADDKFHQRFNIDLGVDEAKRRFVNRASILVIHEGFYRLARRDISNADVFERFICKKLGEKYKGYACLSTILGEDFIMHLRALEAMYEYSDTQHWADRGAKDLLNESEIDLGVRWQNGKFIVSGSPLLDEKLVDDVLIRLKSPAHKGVLHPFGKGLDHFLHSMKNPALLPDVVTDMYESLEALAKIVNNNDKDLSANREALVANLKLAEPYKRMLKEYIEYANDFARHAGERGQAKLAPSRREVEAFIYQTGLFLRLALSNET